MNIGGCFGSWIQRGTNIGSGARLDFCSFQTKMRLSSPSCCHRFLFVFVFGYFGSDFDIFHVVVWIL